MLYRLLNIMNKDTNKQVSETTLWVLFRSDQSQPQH